MSSNSGIVRVRRVASPGALPGVDAVWWESGMIRAVGSFDLVREEAARAGGPARPVFELPHALLTPGIVDAHTHFGEWALGRSRVQLAGSATRAEAVGRVAAATPADGWILGQGYDPNLWRDPPTREALDAAVPAVPVALDSHDVHALWVNSPALAACGITRATPDPDGGRIVRDANGEPTGVLLERAVSLVTRRLPAVGPDRLLSAVAGAQTAAHRLGVTGIQNVEGPDVLAAFRRLEREDRLRLRVLAHHALEGLDDALAAGVRSGTGSHWLEAGGVKLFLDGALGSQTAWMLEPYRGSDGRGIEVLGLDAARDAVTRGAAGGIAAVVHAIGDAAVRRALDLLEPLPRVGIAHRIEHLQLVHPDDLGRAARAGIVASMQPAHLLTDIPLVERHWGARGAGAYAFRTLLDLGTRLVFGSDVPVETIDPRDGVYAALERVGRDGTPAGGWRAGEKLTFAETLAAYSESGWAAAGRRGKGGVVVAGGAADLVAWACDADAVLKDSGTAFKEGRAVLTVAGGEVMWRET